MKTIVKPDFVLELAHHHGNAGQLVAGIDEAGRGPLAGPVAAAAVIFPATGPSRELQDRLNDSKKLSAAERNLLRPMIESEAASWAVATATVEEIDALNILQASLLAMKRAVLRLAVKPAFALIDGNKIPPGLPCAAESIVKGDSRSLSIAAASILAKESRDAIMRDLDIEHPGYGWRENTGYPTPEHKAALVRLGATDHHRRSFAPVRDAVLAAVSRSAA